MNLANALAEPLLTFQTYSHPLGPSAARTVTVLRPVTSADLMYFHSVSGGAATPSTGALLAVRIYTWGLRCRPRPPLRGGVTDWGCEEVRGCAGVPVGRLGVWW
jgi:hypothetical protein